MNEKRENPTELPISASWLRERMITLKFKPNPKGICFGVAHMAMQAALGKELDLFYARLQLIADIPLEEFKSFIKKAKAAQVLKHKQAKKISSDALFLPEIKNREHGAEVELALDIPIFFMGIEIYHAPDKYPFLFNISNLKQNGKLSMPLVISKKLEQKGGIAQLKCYTGIYDLSSLVLYFNSLSEVIVSSGFKKPFTMVMADGDHVITIIFYPKKNSWKIINSELLEIGMREITSTKTLAIWTCLAFSPVNDFLSILQGDASYLKNITCFRTYIYGRKMDEDKLHHIIYQLDNHNSWKSLHEVNAEKAILVDSKQYSWLHLAVRNDEVPMTVQNLLDAGADPNALSSNGCSSLDIALISHSDSKIIRLLLAANANPNRQNSDKLTSLFLASSVNNIAATKLLLAANADPSIPDGNSILPLNSAAILNHTEIFKLLLEEKAHYASINIIVAFLHAAEQGKILIVKMLLLANIDPNSAFFDGTTPLFVASESGHVNIVNILLAANANPNIARNDGATPLSIANEKKHDEISSILNKEITASLHLHSIFNTTKSIPKEFVEPIQNATIFPEGI